MSESNNALSLKDFIGRVKNHLNSLETIYSGFVIQNLSLPNFDNQKSKIYGNGLLYLSATNENLKITLNVDKSIIDNAISRGYQINQQTSVNVTIQSISLDNYGSIMVKINNIVESGISERETFTRKLDQYCKENKYYEKPKKELKSVIRNIAIISTLSSGIEGDILKNLKSIKDIVLFKVNNTSNDFANKIRELNALDYDLILLFRGGHEDFAMNIYSDIPVLDAIYQSKTHIATALGHDKDTPFVYRVADSNYSTPTNFAQKIEEHNQKTIKEFENVTKDLKFAFSNILKQLETKLSIFDYTVTDIFIEKINSSLALKKKNIEQDTSKILDKFQSYLKSDFDFDALIKKFEIQLSRFHTKETDIFLEKINNFVTLNNKNIKQETLKIIDNYQNFLSKNYSLIDLQSNNLIDTKLNNVLQKRIENIKTIQTNSINILQTETNSIFKNIQNTSIVCESKLENVKTKKQNKYIILGAIIFVIVLITIIFIL